MRSTRKTLLSIVAAAAILLSAWGVSQSALTRSNREIIQIAFMNGYVAAIREDPERIRKLQQDPQLMRQAVEEAAAEYLRKVYEMNLRRGPLP